MKNIYIVLYGAVQLRYICDMMSAPWIVSRLCMIIILYQWHGCEAQWAWQMMLIVASMTLVVVVIYVMRQTPHQVRIRSSKMKIAIVLY